MTLKLCFQIVVSCCVVTTKFYDYCGKLYILSKTNPKYLLIGLFNIINNKYMFFMGLCSEILVVGVYRCGFCENLREASPISDKAGASQL